MSVLLSFDTLHNIRDLGGMPAAKGRSISRGKLIRSGHIVALSAADKEKLAGLVSLIVDFRTHGEHQEKPDEEIAGAVNRHIPIISSWTPGITREEERSAAQEGKDLNWELYKSLVLKPIEAKQYMCDMYRLFAESDFSISQYGKFVKLLLEPQEKAVLWHCTAGKDRAGIASAIVEELLGVPREAILEDYLKTNEYLDKDIRSLTRFMKEKIGTDSEVADESLRYLFGAEQEYILSFYRAVEEKYGSFPDFARNGLGITDQEREEMERIYLS